MSHRRSNDVSAEGCARGDRRGGDLVKFGPGTSAGAGRDGTSSRGGAHAPLLCDDVEPADQQILGPNSIVNSPVEHVTGTRRPLFRYYHMAAVRVWRSEEILRRVAGGCLYARYYAISPF